MTSQQSAQPQQPQQVFGCCNQNKLSRPEETMVLGDGIAVPLVPRPSQQPIQQSVQQPSQQPVQQPVRQPVQQPVQPEQLHYQDEEPEVEHAQAVPPRSGHNTSEFTVFPASANLFAPPLTSFSTGNCGCANSPKPFPPITRPTSSPFVQEPATPLSIARPSASSWSRPTPFAPKAPNGFGEPNPDHMRVPDYERDKNPFGNPFGNPHGEPNPFNPRPFSDYGPRKL